MSDHIDRAAEVLLDHARESITRCRCGWGELGRSHPEHVARVLAAAGLLASPEHDAVVAAKALRDAAGRVRQMHDAATPRGIAAALMVDATRIEREAGESDADA